jgi:hypothetical protein
MIKLYDHFLMELQGLMRTLPIFRGGILVPVINQIPESMLSG